MTLEFDIKISDKDMYRFNMHHAYTGFQGIFATVIGLAVLTVAALTRGKVDTVYTLLYLLFGILFLIYMPVSLWMRVRRYHAPDHGCGIDIGIGAHHRSGIQNTVAAHFHVIAKHGSHFL